jgi:hypothetical protein
MPMRRLYRRAGWWALITAVFAFHAWSLTAHTGWPLTTLLKHLGAFAGCDSAAIVGLAKAARGSPGYWDRHDQVRDGIACN